ncbi:acyl-CoA dehydrogenase family protein [Nocardia rhizosphaerihabitans]|uniref:Acyl-CoA dehydrogenase n=1 Tax=Nocardia rhizosphaerihabitans TaxID=1691570 RepID=A0ABQ2K9G4_9NOCA|nr:acyl-CoA dehydrogenase family protein [Nocardia rhizosphaerihabitans]GGN74693.1 acyl-CoA dehydrogenase [Nocardia rhizosphaerihabitans]
MYQWSDEDLMFRDAVRGFIAKEVTPHVDQLESGALPPFDIIRKLYATFGLDEMAREGLEKAIAREEAGTTGSGKSGGGFSGAGSMGVILNSELAGVSLGLVASMGVSLGLTAGTIRSRGTLAQKKRWLPELVTMAKVGAWAITEPDSGSDAFGGMKSYVRRDGEDYILNGRKTFITNGPYADVTVVYAKLDEEDGTDRRDRKVLTFVLDKGMPGFVQSPAFKKMGMNSSPTGELFFENVRITPDRLLGETENPAKGDGKDSAKESFAAERIGIASLALGIINECHRLCIDYAKSRKLWGKEIAQFQLIQLKLAEMEIARINVQNMVFNAIERTAAGDKVTLAEASAMKLYSSRAATEVAMEAVQLFGGNGYMAEYKVEQLARDAKSLMIYAGSNEIQVTHIAKGLIAG